MREFIFKKRDDGLFILDLRKTAERLMASAKLLAKYQPADILIVASRVYSGNPAIKFSKLTGIPVLQGRFVPGTMVNLMSKQFKEPKIVFVCDPKGEREAIAESAQNGVPVISLCDSDNETKFIDLIVPINNKGRRSLALVFYVLAREIMLHQGKIKSYDEFNHDINFFERLDDDIKEVSRAVVVKSEEPASAPEEEKAEEPKAAEKKPEKKKKKEETKEEHKTEAKKEKHEEKTAEKQDKKKKEAEEKAAKKEQG
jgi:small subunit ribosomal protein S2